MLAVLSKRIQKTVVPLNDKNVFDKIARIEGQHSLQDDNKSLDNAKNVVLISKICVSYCVGLAIFHILCNNIPNSTHRNDLFFVSLNDAFHHNSVFQAAVFNAGVSSMTILLLIRRSSNEAFTKFLHPMLRWSVYGILPPGWIYFVVYNFSELSSNALFQDIWLMSQGVSFFVPLIFLGGLVHILDVDGLVWSRPNFIIYCISLLGTYTIPTVTFTRFVLSHTVCFILTLTFLSGWMATQTMGYINWVRSPKKDDTVKRRNQDNLISIILFYLTFITWGNIAVDVVSVLCLAVPNSVSALQLRIFALESLFTAILTLIIFNQFTKSLIEDQSRTLELVVVNHGQVFEKPPTEEQVGWDYVFLLPSSVTCNFVPSNPLSPSPLSLCPSCAVSTILHSHSQQYFLITDSSCLERDFLSGLITKSCLFSLGLLAVNLQLRLRFDQLLASRTQENMGRLHDIFTIIENEDSVRTDSYTNTMPSQNAFDLFF